ncbi:MAG: L,D-transpeptidase family protein [Prosthecobacter sp.]
MALIDRIPESFRSTSLLFRLAVCGLTAGGLSQCTSSKPKGDVVVSVKDQKLGIYSADGKLAKKYVISTSKFGLGDIRGSNRTPLGKHEIVAKIGHGLPAGAVLKSRRWNGEVLKPNAPGRDPIVSRILWLRGTESSNRNAFNRFIYIHGTPEEKNLGKPASYGCVRMGMKDVVDLFNNVNVGAKVVITKDHLPKGTPDKPAEPEVEDAVAAAGSEPADAETSAKAEPIEIAKIVPTEGEKQRAEENASKTKLPPAGQRKPVRVPLFRTRPADKPDAYTTVAADPAKVRT